MKNSTTIKVPKKYQHMIGEIWTEDDGWSDWGPSYWVSIAEGFYSPDMECHTLHESTQKEILSLIRRIRPETYCLTDANGTTLMSGLDIEAAKEAYRNKTSGQVVMSECTGDKPVW